jgi:dihydrofolate reductase
MNMGKVSTGFSMSLDGFIAGPQDDVGRLFQWMTSGDIDITVSTGDRDIELKVPSKSADMFQGANQQIGALVDGGGKHPLDIPIVVVTHRAPPEWVKEGWPFTFVTDGVESAIEQAKAIAGDKSVAVASTTIVQQCLKAGLLEEIHIDLVPVLLGAGIRLFDHLDSPIELESTEVTESTGVTHLTFCVVK